MNVAFISEDEADSRVLSVALRKLLKTPIEPLQFLVQRGFGAVLKSASVLAQQAAYARVPLICVIVDCDETEDHYVVHAQREPPWYSKATTPLRGWLQRVPAFVISLTK